VTVATRWVDAGTVGAVREGRARALGAGEYRFLLCNVGGTLFAVANTCTHDGGNLGAGRLEGAIVRCPRHGACFDVRDGSVQAPPARRPIASYPVRVGDDGLVQVELPDDPAGEAATGARG
jgi:3-phenylpropionate/trans-cinnamate dioxygenase ferredoxin component